MYSELFRVAALKPFYENKRADGVRDVDVVEQVWFEVSAREI